MGFRQQNLHSRQPFCKSFAKQEVPLSSICWRRLSLSWRNWVRNVIIGIFRTGGSSQDRDGGIIPDALLRLHPGDQGFRLGYLLSSIGRHLGDDRVVHTDRPRKHQGEKGKGKGKGKAPGKGKDKGFAQPKRAAGRLPYFRGLPAVS